MNNQPHYKGQASLRSLMPVSSRECWQILIALLILLTMSITAIPAMAALPNQRTDLKVLLLSADGNEATTGAFEAQFIQEGVAYDKILLPPGHTPLTADFFADTLDGGIPHAKYEAVIIATGGLVYADSQGNYVSALSPDEWTALNTFEATYGIRQITAFAFPTPDYGLNYPIASGDLSGTTAKLTTTGLATFPYLKGPVLIDTGAYGYSSTPINAATFNTLLSSPTGASLLGIFTHPDGREEMVATFDQNAYQLHSRLLRHGMLSWASRGIFLGYQRNYLTLHVDDIFLDDDRWDPTTHTNDIVNTIRMTAKDVTRAINWEQSTGIRLVFVFNGEGASDFGTNDPLTLALLNNKNKFTWINHTFSHLIFDDIDDNPLNGLQPADLDTIVSEIQNNITFAKDNKIPLNKNELVTGGHSGLFNPNMPQALTITGIKWIADDNSRRPVQWQVGPALTVPRYPNNVFYNTSLKAQQLDEYNYIYLPPELGGVCVNTSVTTCFNAPADWNTYLSREVSIMLSHVLSNDPKPHYMHQSNLAGDGLLYLVTNQLLSQYQKYFKPSLVNLSFTESGQSLARNGAWAQAKAAGLLTAYVQNGTITLKSNATGPISVPITGTAVGDVYGGQRSGWQTIPAGGSVVLLPSP